MPGFYADNTEMRPLLIPWQGSASLARREEPSAAVGARGNMLLPQAGKGNPVFPGIPAGRAVFGREGSY